jgi:hypothetical protein
MLAERVVLTETRADRLAVDVPVVDALHDHRQLERRQPDVEAEVGQVPPAARGVPVQHVRLARVAGRA